MRTRASVGGWVRTHLTSEAEAERPRLHGLRHGGSGAQLDARGGLRAALVQARTPLALRATGRG